MWVIPSKTLNSSLRESALSPTNSSNPKAKYQPFCSLFLKVVKIFTQHTYSCPCTQAWCHEDTCSGGKAPCILNIIITWMWIVRFMLRSLCSRWKRSWNTFDKRLSGSQRRWRREKCLHLPRIEPRSSSTWPVTLLTELFTRTRIRLMYFEMFYTNKKILLGNIKRMTCSVSFNFKWVLGSCSVCVVMAREDQSVTHTFERCSLMKVIMDVYIIKIPFHVLFCFCNYYIILY
jgi:hypothetical protein